MRNNSSYSMFVDLNQEEKEVQYNPTAITGTLISESFYRRMNWQYINQYTEPEWFEEDNLSLINPDMTSVASTFAQAELLLEHFNGCTIRSKRDGTYFVLRKMFPANRSTNFIIYIEGTVLMGSLSDLFL